MGVRGVGETNRSRVSDRSSAASDINQCCHVRRETDETRSVWFGALPSPVAAPAGSRSGGVMLSHFFFF